jgi:hypothetical protein
MEQTLDVDGDEEDTQNTAVDMIQNKAICKGNYQEP